MTFLINIITEFNVKLLSSQIKIVSGILSFLLAINLESKLNSIWLIFPITLKLILFYLKGKIHSLFLEKLLFPSISFSLKILTKESFSKILML